MKSHNLEQYVTGSTHVIGHTLDFIIARPADNLVKDCAIDSMISDHNAIHFDLECSKPHPAQKFVTYRKIKDLDTESFKQDILSSDLYTAPANNLADKIKQYDYVLKLFLTNMPLKLPKSLRKKNLDPG